MWFTSLKDNHRPLQPVLLPVLMLSLGLAAQPAHALKTDQEQPINVESIEQTADLQANTLTFIGDVVATQGSIKLKADKVEVTRDGQKGNLKSIIAHGSPVTFEQQQDNGRFIHARAQTLSYLPDSTKIVLQGRVTIWQGESKMTGERIEYNITTQKMRAINNNVQGGRVSSTFVPADFSRK